MAPANVLKLADFHEAAMMQHARDALAAARGAFVDGDPFNSDAMHAQVRWTMKALAESDERNAAWLVSLALAGAEDAHEALRDLISERNERGEPLGSALTTYDNILGDRGRPRLRHPHSRPKENFLAAFTIVCLLIDLMQQFPDLPLRRSTKRRPCACSIVSAVLIEANIGRGGEDAIYKIWKRYGPPVNPSYHWNPKSRKTETT
jgi:hypothetical protein